MKSTLPTTSEPARFGLHALELDALFGLVLLDAVEPRQEIEMPPGAAIFAVGDRLEPDLLLLPDDLQDFRVLDDFELRGRDFPFLALRARFLERRGAQQAADMVGAEWRCGSGH